ncbi:calcium-binding protein [Phaeobacter marinintestinus]|uniref:calcium-binding protein n=1 Tax=Falsiphaeobacter marinintestinus TaxID=1492905 RepID=UPI0011B7BED1|nr:calcium-binding protein [Phaeobacter marinintestinus]
MPQYYQTGYSPELYRNGTIDVAGDARDFILEALAGYLFEQSVGRHLPLVTADDYIFKSTFNVLLGAGASRTGDYVAETVSVEATYDAQAQTLQFDRGRVLDLTELTADVFVDIGIGYFVRSIGTTGALLALSTTAAPALVTAVLYGMYSLGKAIGEAGADLGVTWATGTAPFNLGLSINGNTPVEGEVWAEGLGDLTELGAVLHLLYQSQSEFQEADIEGPAGVFNRTKTWARVQDATVLEEVADLLGVAHSTLINASENEVSNFDHFVARDGLHDLYFWMAENGTVFDPTIILPSYDLDGALNHEVSAILRSDGSANGHELELGLDPRVRGKTVLVIGEGDSGTIRAKANAKNVIFGGDGENTIYGSNQDDWIYAGRGNDFIHADRGSDFIAGGLGHDTVSYADYFFASGGLTVSVDRGMTVEDSRRNTDTMDNVELLELGSGNDTIKIVGSTDYYQIDAGDGYDVLEIPDFVSDVRILANGDVQLSGSNDGSGFQVGTIIESVEEIRLTGADTFFRFDLSIENLATAPKITGDRAFIHLDFSESEHSLIFGDEINGGGAFLDYSGSTIYSTVGSKHGDTWTTGAVGWTNFFGYQGSGLGNDIVQLVGSSRQAFRYEGGDDVVSLSNVPALVNLQFPQTVNLNEIHWTAVQTGFQAYLHYDDGEPSHWNGVWSYEVHAILPDGGSIRFTDGQYSTEWDFGFPAPTANFIPFNLSHSGGIGGTHYQRGRVELNGFSNPPTVIVETAQVGPDWNGQYVLSTGLADDSIELLFPDGTVNAVIALGGGDDRIEAAPLAGLITIYGYLGDDVVHASTGDLRFIGSHGNDELYAHQGGVRFSGGAGDDLMVWDSAKTVGNIVSFTGDAGQDTLRLELRASDVTPENAVELSHAWNFLLSFNPATELGADNFVSLAGGLILAWDIEVLEVIVDGVEIEPLIARRGTGGDDMMFNRPGFAEINAGGGDDIIHGSGIEIAEEGEPTETLKGGSGNDVIFGHDGNDWLQGEGGDDILDAGDGDDVLDGGMGENDLFGGNGDDLFFGSAGQNNFDGGNGTDTVSYELLRTAVSLDLRRSGGGQDTLQDIEILQLTDGKDQVWLNDFGAEIYGYGGNDTLVGSNLDDRFVGGTGDDSLTGKAGDDALLGGDGNDTLTGGGGADLIDGGQGYDIAVFQTAVTLVIAQPSLSAGEAKGDTFIAVEEFRGSRFDDIMIGDLTGNVLRGGAGNDDLYGGGGSNVLHGEAGTDNLYGGIGADELIGGEHDDLLDGGQGDDILTGDGDVADNDRGADTFRFKNGYVGQSGDRGIGDDIVTDFQPGIDKLDFGSLPGTVLDHLDDAEQVGSDVRFTFENPATFLQVGTVTLKDINLSDLSVTDFIL